MKKKLIISSLIATATILLILLISWSTIIFSKDPFNKKIARIMPWPVVCTFKGCITTTKWINHNNMETSFSENVDQEAPTALDTLTTLTRQHIVNESFLKSPVTRSGAKRYREEILNLKNEEQLNEVIDLSLQEYDELIVIPWLKQEALRQEHEVETSAELFSLLSQDKFIVVWPFHFKWNKEAGEIVQR